MSENEKALTAAIKNLAESWRSESDTDFLKDDIAIYSDEQDLSDAESFTSSDSEERCGKDSEKFDLNSKVNTCEDVSEEEKLDFSFDEVFTDCKKEQKSRSYVFLKEPARPKLKVTDPIDVPKLPSQSFD